jgi:hypothetical protein
MGWALFLLFFFILIFIIIFCSWPLGLCFYSYFTLAFANCKARAKGIKIRTKQSPWAQGKIRIKIKKKLASAFF